MSRLHLGLCCSLCVTLEVSLCVSLWKCYPNSATLCFTLGWSWSWSWCARGSTSQADINHCRWRGSGWQARQFLACGLWCCMAGRVRPPNTDLPVIVQLSPPCVWQHLCAELPSTQVAAMLALLLLRELDWVLWVCCGQQSGRGNGGLVSVSTGRRI